MGADKMLVKPMQTAVLLRQIEKMLDAHSAKLARLATAASAGVKKTISKRAAAPVKRGAKKLPAKKVVVKKPKRRRG